MNEKQGKQEATSKEKIETREFQLATFNILEDFNEEKEVLKDTQRALLNILDDFNIEKTKVENANYMLLLKTKELNRSNAELQKAHGILELRVEERTAELRQSNTQLQAEMEERKRVEEDIKQLNKDLLRRAAELETSNKELESFSYTVSHDLRAPLRSIDGFSLAVLEDYADKLDEQGKVFLQSIRASSQKMARLIDDILGLSRVIRTELRMERFDLSATAESIMETLRNNEGGRTIRSQIMPCMEVVGDRNLLGLVLENLFGNAIKFTAHRKCAMIEFGFTESEGKRIYYVRDNGAGFDMTYVDKLFKPFQRLHTVEEFPGTGIGLASVQRIIHRHGGAVWAEGEVDKGATIYFTLNAEG